MKTKDPRRRAPEPVPSASPELLALIKTYDTLPPDNWDAARAIRDRHGPQSKIGKNIETVWAAQGSAQALHLYGHGPALA